MGGPPILYSQTVPQVIGFQLPFTITSVPVSVPAGPHICSCDVYMTHVHEADFNEPKWDSGHHLIGPVKVQGEFGVHLDNFVTFNLNYTGGSATDYPEIDFQLIAQPIGP
jgi:hypothetical protein